MADSLNLGQLSLADSQHATGMGGRSAYIPPHMRGSNSGHPPSMDGPPPMMNGDINHSVWSTGPRLGLLKSFLHLHFLCLSLC